MSNTKKYKCDTCKDKGWFFVNDWIGHLQGRRDCKCGQPQILQELKNEGEENRLNR